jgi:RimJ/RimL family protein N-acetyltransferase
MITDDSFIDFKCPYCGQGVSFPQSAAGQTQECPECYQSLIVPRAAQEFAEKVPLPILTPRLALRRLCTGDWQDLLEILSHDDVLQYTDRFAIGEQEILQWLEADQHVKLTTRNSSFCLGMALQDGGKVIGKLDLNFNDHLPLQATVNIDVNPGFQRQGLATEAMNGALDFCFARIGLHRVRAFCDARNLAAHKLAEKVGMRREGEGVEDRLIDAQWVNTTWYAILEQEYHQARNIPPPRSTA